MGANDAWNDFSAGPGRHHESYQRETCLLPELGIIGWLRFFSAFDRALEPDTHKGEFEIHYIVSGELNWWVEDTTYDLRAGMALIIAPDELHGSTSGVLEPCEHYWLRLGFPEKKALPGLTLEQTKSLKKEFMAIRQRAFPVSISIRDAFAQMIAEHHAPRARSRLISRSALHILLACITRDYEKATAQPAESRAKIPLGIQRGLREIHDHLENPPTVEELAKTAHMSESSFRKVFKEAVGCSPHDYLTRRRVQAAREMLNHGKDNITDIAFSLGFSSSQYFATVFKRVTGVSPSDYPKD